MIRSHDGLKVIVPALDADDLSGAVLDHELGQLVMRNPNRPKPVELGTLTTTDDTAMAVRTVVDEQVNPALAAHGGYITFMGHDGEGKVFVTMGGGCHGCSMSRLTMLQGVADDDHRSRPWDHEGGRRHRPRHRREPVLQLTPV